MAIFRDIIKIKPVKSERISLEEQFQKEKDAERWNDFAADFNNGIVSLKFTDNFKAEMLTLTASDSAEVLVDHKLGAIPSMFLVVNGVAGVLRGETEWTNNKVSFVLDNDLYSSKSKEVKLLIFL